MIFELYREVKSSFVLNTYNKIYKISKYIPHFKWFTGLILLISLVDTIINGDVSKSLIWVNLSIWILGLIFAFLSSLFHLLTGIKLKEMSKKYSLNKIRLKEQIDDILNTKK